MTTLNGSGTDPALSEFPALPDGALAVLRMPPDTIEVQEVLAWWILRGYTAMHRDLAVTTVTCRCKCEVGDDPNGPPRAARYVAKASNAKAGRRTPGKSRQTASSPRRILAAIAGASRHHLVIWRDSPCQRHCLLLSDLITNGRMLMTPRLLETGVARFECIPPEAFDEDIPNALTEIYGTRPWGRA